MAGKTIPIPTDSDTFTGYLAVPASGSGPGLVLIQEIFGVNAQIRATADLFAEEGYVVLAPDLFWRLQPDARQIVLVAGASPCASASGWWTPAKSPSSAP